MDLDDLLDRPGRRRWWLLSKGLEAGLLEEALKWAQAADNFCGATTPGIDATFSLETPAPSLPGSALLQQAGAVASVEDRSSDQFDGRKAALSQREAEILQLLIRGCINKVIAHRLSIAEATVKVHLKAILRKTGMANRTQAAIWAMKNGISAEQTASLSR
jgi:DNA-binding NarL/FixJ family response regulator